MPGTTSEEGGGSTTTTGNGNGNENAYGYGNGNGNANGNGNGNCSNNGKDTSNPHSNNYVLQPVENTSEGFDPGDLTLTLPDGKPIIIPDNNQPAVVSAPYWLQIQRSGSTFTSLASIDGITWTTLGTATITMPTTVYMGLECDSNNGSLLNVSTFDHVAMYSAGNTAPTWVTPATASASVVTGTNVNLSAVARSCFRALAVRAARRQSALAN